MCDSTPVQTTALRGAYGIARFAEREPVESDGHTRSTCGVRELRDAPVGRSVRQRAAAARRPTSIVCWWRSGDAGGAEDRRRAPATTGPPRSSVRPTRHSPPHGDIRVSGWWPLTALGLLAPRKSVVAPGGTERSSISPRVSPFSPNLSRARARGAALAARARGWCATAPRFKQLR